MGGQITIILLLLLSFNPQSTIATVDICIAPTEATACYDKQISFEKDEVLTWSITEATYNGTRVQVEDSFVDSWKIEALFNDKFTLELLNNHDFTPPTSTYEFNFINENGNKSSIDKTITPFSIDGSNWKNELGTFFGGTFLTNQLFNHVNLGRIGFHLSSQYIVPTLYQKNSVQENRFEWFIREIQNDTGVDNRVIVFNHAIIDNNYHATYAVFIDDFPQGYVGAAPPTIQYEFSFNIDTGILQRARYISTFYTHDLSSAWLEMVLEVKLEPQLLLIHQSEELNLPLFLLIATPILIIAVFIIYRRLNRT